MGEPDAEEQAVAGGGLHGQGLLGQHHGMTRVDRDHARPQLDARYLGPGGGQQCERVIPENLHGKGMVEPGLGELLQLLHHPGD